MIGNISLGTSFYHCISYCLEDKRRLSENEKLSLFQTGGLQHKNRAEVLDYNKCFGNKYELAEQFKDVRKLSRRVEKPVLHLSLRLAKGEILSNQQLIEMGRALAKEFEVNDNQYITILHKDTPEQHIHVVANRVGYNGKAASTSNNFLKMDWLCRRLEKEYHLKEVFSARRFLSKEQRLIPRHDTRKDKLKTDIRQTLEKVTYYADFEKRMQSLGYRVIKGRGISFIDDKKVKVKGSEVGFSLANIEKVLKLKQQLKIEKVEKLKRNENANLLTPSRRLLQKGAQRTDLLNFPINLLEKEINNLLYNLLKTEQNNESLNQEFLNEFRKKKKHRHRHRH